jgi:alginate O-acetyltransferase complex protein AlgI
VYRPLTTHRQSQFRRASVMLLTWVLFALWHGGTWNFLWWGLLNGLVLACHRMWRRPLRRIFSFPGRSFFSRAVWLIFFIPSMALFRSPDVQTAVDYAWRMFTLAPGPRGASLPWAGVIAILLAAHVASRRWYEEGVFAKWQWPARIATVSAFSTMLALWSTSDKPFIYFQF